MEYREKLNQLNLLENKLSKKYAKVLDLYFEDNSSEESKKIKQEIEELKKQIEELRIELGFVERSV